MNPPRSPELPARRSEDWAGLWFKLLAEEGGEFTGIRFGRRLDGQASPQWVCLPHVEVDGVGGFACRLRDQGLEQAARRLPELREPRPSGRLARWVGLLRFVSRRVRRPAPWLSRDPGWRSRPESARLTAPPAAWAVARVDAGRTAALESSARARGVSLNSWLLWALARAARPGLGAGPEIWMVPVNMRGPVRGARDTANHAAYVQVELQAGDSAEQVHGRIRRALRRKEHWGAWLVLSGGRFFGYGGMRRIFHADRRQGRAWVGTFSNIGEWPELCAEHGEWFFCPPVFENAPLAAGAITCGGALSLTLQLHPSIGREAGEAQALLDRWMAELG